MEQRVRHAVADLLEKVASKLWKPRSRSRVDFRDWVNYNIRFPGMKKTAKRIAKRITPNPHPEPGFSIALYPKQGEVIEDD